MAGWLTKRNKKRLLGLVVGLVMAGLGLYLNQHPAPSSVLGTIAPGYYRVVEVADGDTISVDMNGKTERIRLLGVDTPETQDPRKPVQCFGQAATDFTKQLINNQPVRLTADELSTNSDRYDRLLRYAYLPDGRLVQEEIIRQGYGFAYTHFPLTRSAHFKQLEDEARQNGRGLWAKCQPTANESGGYTSNPE